MIAIELVVEIRPEKIQFLVKILLFLSPLRILKGCENEGVTLVEKGIQSTTLKLSAV